MERKRASLPLQGIDRATPDDEVKDGACEDLYNLRYRAGAFETVCAPLLLHPVTEWNGYSVVSRLDDMPSDEYIARKGDTLYHIRIESGAIESLGELGTLPGGASGVRYFRFGRMFYVNYQQDGQLREVVWYYREGSFAQTDLASLEPPSLEVSCEWESAATERVDLGGYIFNAVKLATILRDENNPQNNTEEWFYNVGVDALQEKGYVVGTYLAFAAWRLFDGSFVKASAPVLVSGDMGALHAGTTTAGLKIPPHPIYKTAVGLEEVVKPGNDNNYWKPKDERHYNYYGRRCGAKATLRLTIPAQAEAMKALGLIEGVSIFATRPVDAYAYEELPARFGSEGQAQITDRVEKCWAASHHCILNREALESLPEGPFYRIVDLDPDEWAGPLELEYDKHFEHIVNEEVWSADYSLHYMISALKIDYNDRLHIADLRTDLFRGYNPFHTGASGSTLHFGRTIWTYRADLDPAYECGADWHLTVNGEDRIARGAFFAGIWSSGSAQGFMIRNPVFYPDSRCRAVDLWARRRADGTTVFHKRLELESHPASNGAAYLYDRYGVSDVEGYPALHEAYSTRDDSLSRVRLYVLSGGNQGGPQYDDFDVVYGFPSPANETVVERNKVRVSASGNPFEFAAANVYAVGGSGEQIREIVSTAERMTEAAYGYQPLLVFTDRAVYALESGEGEVLYARNIPILSRAIYEGTNAAEGNGSVFFCCSAGVISITRGKLAAISETLRRAAGHPAAEGSEEPDFDLYLRSSRLLFNRKESELVVYNPAYSYAWLYSLSGGYWSRRDWEAAVEPCFDRIVVGGGVASLSEEDISAPAAACGAATRPLKFGSLEYKRIETLAARMRWGDRRRFVLSLEGSDDGIHWAVLRSEPDLPYIRRTPSSFRYHRVRLSGSGGDYLAVSRFDFEYLVKFVHRLR